MAEEPLAEEVASHATVRSVHYSTIPRNSTTIFGHPLNWPKPLGNRLGIKLVFDGVILPRRDEFTIFFDSRDANLADDADDLVR
jgi:hypothetical protein